MLITSLGIKLDDMLCGIFKLDDYQYNFGFRVASPGSPSFCLEMTTKMWALGKDA
jgi:hypothetical protein